MLSSLKKTSPGLDGVPYRAYKNCAIELAPVVTHLINVTTSIQDKRLFQCGSQEAGLVKYDKNTCKNEQYA